MTARPEATIEAGRVRGLWRDHRDAAGSTTRHAIFLGIPFAAPPVGDARFDAPRAVERWIGVRNCVAFGPTPQRHTPYIDPRIPEPSVPGAGTLTINVTTPNPHAGADLPVLVWIHGGGFIGGSPASPWYGGQAFARDDVVTVTISYRLGFEGFGWVEGAVNNRGVRDWLAGLEWVQRNIRALGGDPARVTIGGQSAGGSAVMRLLTMPSAQHLFAAVLAISPADCPATADDAKTLARRIAARAGTSADLAGFSAVPERTLDAARVAGFERQTEDYLVALVAEAADMPALTPSIDGDIVHTSAVEAIASGVGADKPLLIGTTAHEFNHVAASLEKPAEGRRAAEVLVAAGLPKDLADAMAARDAERGTGWTLAQAYSDVVFRRCAAGWSDARAATGALTWAYDFRWESSAPGVVGAAHCVDVPFGFDVLGAPGARAATGPAPQVLADAVHGDWLALIRDGRVAAPQFVDGRSTIVYDASARRSIAPGYALESRLWAVTQP